MFKIDYEEPSSLNIGNTINDALMEMVRHFDDYFRTILKKNNIEESDWKSKGRVICRDGINYCSYGDRVIFMYTDAEVKMNGQYSASLIYKAGEPGDVLSKM